VDRFAPTVQWRRLFFFPNRKISGYKRRIEGFWNDYLKIVDNLHDDKNEVNIRPHFFDGYFTAKMKSFTA